MDVDQWAECLGKCCFLNSFKSMDTCSLLDAMDYLRRGPTSRGSEEREKERERHKEGHGRRMRQEKTKE